jgi:hypothetical protein
MRRHLVQHRGGSVTWFERILLIWLTGSVVLAIGIARVLKQPENVEETLREQVRQERLAAAPWN